MKTKTWKIGEYARGGIITVEITGKVIVIIGKEWDHSAGSRRSSNQSNAKEFTRGTIAATDYNARHKVDEFLNELTSCYYADKIMEWIEQRVNFNMDF